ncbi:MAG: hypothetical protein HYR74_11485 [Candidatus Eisenbacteria bacterium]|nr:hypothetical protein [Candidatus Eisenbacteria bacterium]
MSSTGRALIKALWVIMVLLGPLAALELGLRYAVGLGNPILYDNTYAYGYRPVPNQSVARTARKRIRINDRGLRATRDWPAAKDTSQIRLLYLGDSVTYGGSSIDDRETFAEISAADLTKRIGRDVLVGNAGVNGWGPLNILGLIEHEGFWGSDVVVLVAQEADFERTLSHVAETPFWNHKPSFALEELISTNVAYPFSSRRYLPKERFVAAGERDSLERVNLGVFLDIGRRARAAGAKVLMAWHPSRDAVAGEDDRHHAAFIAASSAAGFATLDLYPVLRRDPHPTALYLDPLHLDARGHAIYGATFAESLAALLRSAS